MPTVETGFYLLILIMAFSFTLIGFISRTQNIKGLFHIVGVALFMVLTVWGVSGYEISTSITEEIETAVADPDTATGGDLLFFTENNTRTEVFITGGESTSWLGYAFLGLAALNLVIFVKDVWKAE